MIKCKPVFVFLITLFIIACGEKMETHQDTGPVAEIDTTNMTEEEKIEAAMTTFMERLWEGDKSVLYENEFSYYKAQNSLSEYMELYRVYEYIYDTIRGIEFDSVQLMGESAKVWARVVYESFSGSGRSEQEYDFFMYNFENRWIKPYMSVAGSQLEIEYLENLDRYNEESEGN
jgi:hypothetical protein